MAVGAGKGLLNVFDLRTKSMKPIINSDKLDEIKHLDDILDLQWISKNANTDDQNETLVSVGADGKILEWST